MIKEYYINKIKKDCNKKIDSYHPLCKPEILNIIIDELESYRGRVRQNLNNIVFKAVSFKHMKCIKYRSLYSTNEVLFYVREELSIQ